MKHHDRPTQITTILKTIDSTEDTEIRAELETYIADLEAKQPNRPTRISAILKTIGAQYPADVESSLQAYISNLEANQQAVAPSDELAPLWDLKHLPIWSHQRSTEREQYRRECASKLQNTYQ